MDITKIRLWCNTHLSVLKESGNGRIFYPTFNTLEPEIDSRTDKDGWLSLDMSEMYCPTDDECDGDWAIQSENEGWEPTDG